MRDVNRIYKSIGVLIVGVLISFALAFVKLFIGLKVNSLCILLDAVNSFFDVAGGFITIFAFGFILHGKDENGLGYGRAEYLASFVVSVGIVGFGILFLFRAIDRLMLPVPIWFGWTQFYAVLGALLGKIALGIWYYLTNKKLKSKALRAMVVDSFLDMGLTAMSLISFIVSKYSAYAVDGIFGIVLSSAIIIFGIKMIYDSVNLLLGTAHKKGAEQLRQMLKAVESIIKIGQIRISDYGYDNLTAVAQVQISDDLTYKEILEILDEAKKSVKEITGIDIEFALQKEISEDKKIRVWKNGKLQG